MMLSTKSQREMHVRRRRQAATLLASTAVLVVSLLTAAEALAATPPCTEDNRNGCVELSPSPPQQTTAVPPNIVMFLDDSGSMQWNFMPDWSYLPGGTSDNALIDSKSNGVYYDPSVAYAPPPTADGGTYASQTNMKSVPVDGFGALTTEKINLLTYSTGTDSTADNWEYYECNGGVCKGNKVPYNTVKSVEKITNKHYKGSASRKSRCRRKYEDMDGFGGYTYAYGTCEFDYKSTETTDYALFQFSRSSGDGTYTTYYVGETCPSASELGNCATASTISGESGGDDPAHEFAPDGATIGENVANWFAYYHTRILMAKSGLMIAFSGLSPNYRFGYGTINKKVIEKVAPYEDGAPGTRKAGFWNWLDGMYPSGSTPLRRALQAIGDYYETSQPWKTMEGDPNYVQGGDNEEELSCRASYAILTSDGFWNGGKPSSGSGAASSDGPKFTASDGTDVQYEAVKPFKGGGASGGSLADVAAYYWKRDLRDDTDDLVPTNGNDPAFWQHMTTFTMGIGFAPEGLSPSDVTMNQVFAWAHDGGGSGSSSAIAGFDWPDPDDKDIYKIADMAHAAVTGHGDFFSATNPSELAAGFSSAIAQISARNVASPPSASNTGVAVTGALTFSVGYSTSDWTGTLEAKKLNPDGTNGELVWDVGGKLDALDYNARKVYTAVYKNVDCSTPGSSSPQFDKGINFTAINSNGLDCAQKAGLENPTLAGGLDTLSNRIDFLLGDKSHEGSLYRTRSHKLGAVINSSPIYVAFPNAGYRNIWPSESPEAQADTTADYSHFVTAHATREGTAYVGANDGMLHAFSAPAPTCDYQSDPGNPTCTYGTGGNERWAFVPRAVYANLGNLTDMDFHYRPTADGQLQSGDVFFAGAWHTILTAGVGLGGRGVYALDITDPTSFDASNVLWEFDSDMTTGSCISNSGNCRATDLGYTVPTPAIGRLANDKWVVLVPNGYFPDCSKPDVPTHEDENGAKTACKDIAAQAPVDADGKPYSALFVLDAETGSLIAELKTPTNISGVTSFGLSSAVLGDYESDQIGDAAFAGDLQGNVWRFDLSDPSPSNWSVSLIYKGKASGSEVQGLQPVTVMPRLFPDLRSNRFMVVFGTGKYLGVGDNSTDIPVQSMYGIQEPDYTKASPDAVTRADLTQQTLSEAAGTDDLAGATLRKLTDAALDVGKKGWYVDLDLESAKGERVVETPAAIFATNTAIYRSLVPDSNNYCDPSLSGAVMAVNASNGGSAGGISSLGFNDYVGARVAHAPTGGRVPVVQRLGGGSLYVPVEIQGATPPTGTKTPSITVDSPLWRRRSWSILKSEQ